MAQAGDYDSFQEDSSLNDESGGKTSLFGKLKNKTKDSKNKLKSKLHGSHKSDDADAEDSYDDETTSPLESGPDDSEVHQSGITGLGQKESSKPLTGQNFPGTFTGIADDKTASEASADESLSKDFQGLSTKDKGEGKPVTESAQDSLASGKDQTADKLYGAKDQSADKLYGAKDQSADKLYGAKDQTADKLYGAKDQTADKLYGAKDQTADTLGGAKEQTANTLGGAKEQTANTLGGAKDQTANTLGGAKDQTANTLGAAKDQTVNTLGAAKDKTVDTLSGAKDQTTEKVSGAADSAPDASATSDAGKTWSQWAAEKVGYAKETAAAKAPTTEDGTPIHEAAYGTAADKATQAKDAAAPAYGTAVDKVYQAKDGVAAQFDQSSIPSDPAQQTYFQKATGGIYGAKDSLFTSTQPGEHDKALSQKVTESVGNLPASLKSTLGFGGKPASSPTTTAGLGGDNPVKSTTEEAAEAPPQSPGLVGRITGLFGAKKPAEGSPSEATEVAESVKSE